MRKARSSHSYLLLPPNRLRPSFFAIFFKRLDKNQRNFRSEHLRTCPNFHYLDILLSHKYFRHFPLTRNVNFQAADSLRRVEAFLSGWSYTMTTWISSTLPGLCLRRCLGSDRSVASRLRRPARSGPGRRRVGRGAWRWAGGNTWWRYYHVPSGLQELF